MLATLTFNPDQERDEKGQWAPSGEKAAAALDPQAAPPVNPTALTKPSANSVIPTADPTEDAFKDFDLAHLTALDQGAWQQQDPVLAEMWRVRGFDGKPEVLPLDEFERRVESEGMTVLYRGVEAPTQEKADEYAEQFRTGDKPFAGQGRIGSGTYFSDNPDTGVRYTGVDLLSAGNHAGALIKIAIPADYKTIDSQDLSQELTDAAEAMGLQHPEDRPAVERAIVKNQGRYATAMGYQAVTTSRPKNVNETFYNLQDRSAVIVEAAP